MRTARAWAMAILPAAWLGLEPGSSLAAMATKYAAAKSHRAMKGVPVAAQGFEVKTVIGQEALVLQKGGQVFWCSLRVAKASLLSQQSDRYSVR